MGDIIGPERIYDRILPRPAAYTAGAPGSDGTALDAGTLLEMQNEAHWLIHESCRHLGTVADSFTPPVRTDVDGAWAAVPGVVAPPKNLLSTDFFEAKRIPWDRQSAARFDGAHVIEDRKGASGEALPRTVAFEVLYDTGPDVDPSLSKLLFALTYDPNPQAVQSCSTQLGTYAEVALAASTTGQWASVKLNPTQPAPDARARWRARGSSAQGSIVSVCPLYLWVGWRLVGTSSTGCAIRSISIFETRS